MCLAVTRVLTGMVITRFVPGRRIQAPANRPRP